MGQRRNDKGNAKAWTGQGSLSSGRRQVLLKLRSLRFPVFCFILQGPSPALLGPHSLEEQVHKCGERCCSPEQIMRDLHAAGKPRTLGLKSLLLGSNPNTTTQFCAQGQVARSHWVSIFSCKWVPVRPKIEPFCDKRIYKILRLTISLPRARFSVFSCLVRSLLMCAVQPCTAVSSRVKNLSRLG